ncbi:MAG: 23S rRNA (adenine(2030)-N(6))-methyltransferase RlmJ [Proteobacteria bacterium]|nr:23S rRNA (adenine(2030)-N(6))-methyltransferase RlmJ [Pseudomonadota bacterium]
MLSYQHAYHAGCLADVHKHAALAALIEHLQTKQKPLSYIDTHAGRGLYNLASAESKKTGEAAAGIVPILHAGAIPPEHPYARSIAETRRMLGPAAYPGSPEIARRLLEPDDQLYLMELHPQEHAALKRVMTAPNIHVHKRDGFEGALALSPPTPRRGLVFIDPSYEIKTEYQAVAEFVLSLNGKWPTAVIVLWYPVLEAGLHIGMADALAKAALPNFTRREISFGERGKLHRIKGSGLIVVNEPFGVGQALDGAGKLAATAVNASMLPR